MPGPPPIPFQLRLLRGNPGRRRMRPEPEPALAPVCPDPPSFLTGYAADEWWRVAPELHRLGLLTVVDVPAFGAYCYAYKQWRMAAEVLAKMQANDPVMSGLIVKTMDGNARANPMVSVVRKLAGDMVRYAGEFGMTPVARSRIAAGIDGQPPPPGKFDGLLG